jgi:hypothetical protein
MAEISLMCTNHKCHARRGCLRHEATPKRFGQASAYYAPDKDGSCKDFVPLKVAKYLGKTAAA